MDRPAGRRRRLLLTIPLVLVALLALGEILGWPFLRAPAQALLFRQLQRPVAIAAPFRVHLLGSLRIRAGGLWIGAPEQFGVPHLVDARDARLKLRYRDLQAMRGGGPVRIAVLSVGEIDARLVRLADGTATWQFGPPRAGPPQPLPAVGHLAVGEGRIVVDDPVSRAELEVGFSTDEGDAGGEAASRAEARGKLRGHELRASLSTAGFIDLAGGDESGRPVPARAVLDYGGVHAEFDGTVTDLTGVRDLQGKALARGSSLALLGDIFGLVLPTTEAFSLRGTVEKAGERWSVTVDEARVGDSRLGGRFAYDAAARPPLLEGELHGRRFILADLAPAFGTRRPDGKPAQPPAGRVLPDRPLDLPALNRMNARIEVDLEHVDLGNAFAQPIAPLKGALRLEDGRLALTGLDARTARGSVKGEIAVDAARQVPLWRADLSWSGIRLEDWIGAAKARETDREGGEPPPPYFTGVLQGRAKLAGSGNSTADLLGSLDGELTLAVRKGSISHLAVEAMGLDLAQGLGVVLRGDQSLPTRCAVADFAAENGRLISRVALVDTPVTLVLVDGSIDLADETLDLRMSAKPRNVSPFTLRTPIRVRGSFGDPQVAPEAGPLAARALAGIALAFVNPLAALLPFVDPGEETQSPCAQALADFRGG